MLGSLTAVCLQARITGVRARRRTPWSVLEDISHTHTHTNTHVHSQLQMLDANLQG